MMNMTSERVPMNTADQVNQEINFNMEKRLALYAAHPELIDQRLTELDQEWDVERMIETEAPAMTTFGMLIGLAFGRKWLVIPLFAQSMMFLHAVQGWYPLLPLFRRMGFRTEKEIAAERYALKALRGDFKELAADGNHRGDKAFQAARPSGMV